MARCSPYRAACPTTTPLLAAIAGGGDSASANTVWFALAILIAVAFVLKQTVVGRRFEAIGANPLAARAIGLPSAVPDDGLCLRPGTLLRRRRVLAGLTCQPTAFQGDPLLFPSVAVVVLGGTSLIGGRGFPISTVIAAFFLNQLSNSRSLSACPIRPRPSFKRSRLDWASPSIHFGEPCKTKKTYQRIE